MTKKDADVVSLADARNNFPRAEKMPSRERACAHDRGVWVDEHDRIVTCKVCKKPVDPVTVLLKWARDWSFIKAEIRAAEHDAEQMEERAREAKKTAEKVRRHRDARACIRSFLPANVAKQDPRQLGEWMLSILGSHPVVIFEAEDGKLTRRA